MNPDVIQADREAAAAYMDRVKSKRWSIEGILNGGCDNTSIVQAFKNHRLAFASPTPEPSGDALREAFIEGAWAGWRSGLAGEQMDDDFARRAWEASEGGRHG